MTTGTVLVCGATGTQGGHVVDALLAAGRPVAGLTRDADSPDARALADRGVEVVVADLDEEGAFTEALSTVAPVAVFYPSLGPDERERGRHVVEAVAGTEALLVLSTGGNCDDRPGVPHVDPKADVEAHARDRLGDRVVVLRPHTFVSNFAMQREAIAAGRLPYPLEGDERRTLVAPADIGRLTARAVDEPARFGGETIELAAGAYTLEELAAALSTAVGREVVPEPMAPEAFAERFGAPESFARFLAWQNEPHGHDAARLREAFGFEPTPLAEALAALWPTDHLSPAGGGGR